MSSPNEQPKRRILNTSNPKDLWVYKYRMWKSRFIYLLKQGLSPKKLALSITFGILIGIVPLFGVSTMAVTGIAFLLRLNAPLAIFINYAVSPIHLLLVIPYIRMGEWLLAVKHSMLTVDSIITSFQEGFFHAMGDLSFYLACGVFGWFISIIPLFIILYVLLSKLFASKFWQHRFSLNTADTV